MADIDKRLRYFNGQFLEQQDFKDEQDYHVDRQRRHNRLLHTYGIAEGLEVESQVGTAELKVKTGTALDDEGRQIVLTSERSLNLNEIKGQTGFVVISYDEVAVLGATVGKVGEMTRLEEQPKVELVVESNPPSTGTHIRLARVTVGPGGTLSTPVDESVRQNASVRLGDQVTMKSLRLSNSSVDDDFWPALYGDRNEIVTSGDLMVAENLSVRGTIFGKLDKTVVIEGSQIEKGSITDAIANGAVTNTKLAQNSVTSDKILDGSVGSSELADLSVHVNKLANASVTSEKLVDYNVITNKIADLSITSGKLGTGSVTTLKLADLNITGAKIADNTISEAKLDAATRGKLGNALGAGGPINGNLTLNGWLWLNGSTVFGYGLDQASRTSLAFGPGDNDGALKSFTTGFRPRLIFVNGAVSFRFEGGISDNNRFGGVTTGVAVVNGATIRQSSMGPRVQRFSGSGNFAHYAMEFGGVAGAYFQQSFTVPTGTTELVITISKVTATEVTFRLTRTLVTGSVAPALIPDFQISVTVLGSYDGPVDANGNEIA